MIAGAFHVRFACASSSPRSHRAATVRTGSALHLHDGRILRTRISHPVNRDTYGAQIWGHILRDQLDVDQATFWDCVHEGVKPGRGVPAPPAEALPAELVHLLLTRVQLTEAEVAAMSKDEAISSMQQFWATGNHSFVTARRATHEIPLT